MENGITWRMLCGASIVLTLNGCSLMPEHEPVDTKVSTAAQFTPILDPEPSPIGPIPTPAHPLPLSTRVPMLEGPLSPDMLKKVAHSIVTFRRSIKPEYQHAQIPSGVCNGFIINDTKNEPLIVTARHCFPDTARSEKDGKIYSTISSSGENIFKAEIEVEEKTLEAYPYNFYIGPLEDVPDVILFKAVDKKFNKPPLPLNLQTPPKWATLHKVSRKDGRIEPYRFQFFEISSKPNQVFFSVEKPELACYPGNSGSPIINNQGEVVAVLVAGDVRKIEAHDVERFVLDPTYKGKDYSVCMGVGSGFIRGLIRTP